MGSSDHDELNSMGRSLPSTAAMDSLDLYHIRQKYYLGKSYLARQDLG